MEIIVKTLGVPDRVAKVEKSTFTIGSDLSCDYVVMAPGIDEKHLSFEIGPQGVVVTNTGEMPVGMRTERGKLSNHPSGKTVVYQEFARIEISDTTIELLLEQDAASVAASDEAQTLGWIGKVRASIFRRPHTALVVGSVLVGSLAWGTTSPGNLFAAPVVGERRSLEANSTDQTSTRSRLEERFGAMPITDLSVIPAGAQYIVRGYTPTNADKRAMVEIAAEFPEDIKLEVHSAEELATTVQSVLDKMGVETEVVSVSGNEAVLGGLLDADMESKMRRSVISDVAGISVVRFETQDATRIAGLLEGKILAVWAGQGPYALRENGEMIHPGDTIFNGLVLQSIDSATELTVCDEPNCWKVDWNG